MDLGFTEDQESLRDLARQIIGAHATTDRLKQVETDPDRFDRALWAELARANLLGVGIPEEHGGIGGGITEVCLLLEQAGATAACVPLWPALILGARTINRYGSPSLRSSLLPRVASGDAVLTAALAEPDADDPLRPATTATWEGDAWRLEGAKNAVPAAHIAERILVPARSNGGVGIFLLDPRAGGSTLERQSQRAARSCRCLPSAAPRCPRTTSSSSRGPIPPPSAGSTTRRSPASARSRSAWPSARCT